MDTQALIRQLHRALAEHLLSRVQNDPPVEIVRQAREFLRDNGIVDAGRGMGRSAALDELASVIPFKAVQ